jgi:hypothetical protein
MNTQSVSQPATANTIKFDDLMKIAAELGSDHGKGKDTQVRFLLKVVEGGYHGALDLDNNKHGADVDDATRLSEAYVMAQTGSTVFDAKAPNQRKLISCVRTCVRLGQWPKGGNGEPLATVNNLMTTRQKLRQKPETAKKLDDAANTLLKYARVQLKRDTLVDDNELQSFCFKSQAPLQTAEQILEGCRKTLMALRDGKAAHHTASDNSTHVVAAIAELNKRLKAIAAERAKK